MSRFLLLLAFALASPLHAARFNVDASNPGAIDGGGRDLSFNLSAIPGTIVSATLQLDINYSRARELNWSLVDNSGVVVLPLASMSGVSSAVTMNGRYRISDRAATTWALAAPASGNLPIAYPARAFQFGQGGTCTNLLARYLEFDIDRCQPLTLSISRLGSASGSGSISAARLIIDNSAPDELLVTGMEEPDHAPVLPRHQRFGGRGQRRGAALDHLAHLVEQRLADVPEACLAHQLLRRGDFAHQLIHELVAGLAFGCICAAPCPLLVHRLPLPALWNSSSNTRW